MEVAPFDAEGVIEMDASTNTLVASSEFRPSPSVSRCNDTPKDRRSTEACAVNVPGSAELIATSQSPNASVPSAQSLASTKSGSGPTHVIVTIAPADGAKPVPSFSSTWTVKMCKSLISSTWLGPISMNASTYRLVASPEFGDVPSVERTSSTPPTMSATEAWAVKMPPTSELIVTAQSPKAFVPSAQSVASTVPGTPPGKVITGTTPSIGSNVEPSRLSSTPKPSSVSTWTVNVCSVRTSFAPDGPIVMNASTNRLVASSEFGALPSVDRESVTPIDQYAHRKGVHDADLVHRIRRDRDRRVDEPLDGVRRVRRDAIRGPGQGDTEDVEHHGRMACDQSRVV